MDGAGAPSDDGARAAAQTMPGDAWSSDRVELLRWLYRVASHLAPLYESAVVIVHDEAFAARTHLVAHCVRELRNRLPDAIAGELRGGNADYRQLAAVIKERWSEDGLPDDGTMPVTASGTPGDAGPRHEVSADLLQSVSSLIVAHDRASGANEASARRLFEALGTTQVPAHLLREWKDGLQWGHRFAHARNKPLKADDVSGLLDRFVAFERTLLAIARRSFENMDELDELLASANS